ncbi:MAG: glycosyltransferase family 39 protein [Candidatus Aquicultor sp.]
MKNIKLRTISYCRNNLHAIIAFALVILAALFLRYRVLPILTQNALFLLTADADSASYLRMFDLAVSHFPRMPASMDYYSSYPWGFKYVLPPMWPYTLAGLSLLVSAIAHIDIRQAAGVIVLALGMAATIPIYFLARELFGKRIALAAVAFALVLPDFALLPALGVDHHIADAFLIPSVFALFLVAQRFFLERNIKGFVLAGIFGGVAIAVSMMMSLSLILVNSMVVLPVVVALFILDRENIKAALASLGALFGFAALTLIISALTTTWPAGGFEFSKLSYFHIAAFGAIATSGALGYTLLANKIKLSLFRSIAGVAIFTALAVAVPAVSQLLLKGYWRSIGSYPLGLDTFELTPLFKPDASWAQRFFSPLLFTAPIAAVWLAARDWRRNSISFNRIFFYVISVSLGFYTVKVRYYSDFLAIFLVISYALFFFLVVDYISSRFKDSLPARLSANSLFALVTAIAVIIVAYPLAGASPGRVDPNLYTLSRYIQQHTPSPGDFSNPSAKPSYGILCNWSWSFQLEYLAERACVSTGNHESGIDGIIAAERFYQIQDEDEAYKMLIDLGVRYVVGDKKFTLWSGDIAKIGEPSANPDAVVRVLRQEELDIEAVRRTMAYRLCWEVIKPPAEGAVEPLHHFRLLYISDADTNSAPFMLFEPVKGARLTINAAPNRPVAIWTRVRANNSRVLPFKVMGRTNAKGMFSTIVPYPSETSDAVKAGPYRLQVGYSSRTVDVSEQAVRNGDELVVKW